MTFARSTVLTVALLSAAPAWAQGAAVLTGTVVDSATKKPVADAVVTATSPALQGEQTVVTDKSGGYRIPQLPPGPYTLRVEADGYKPYSRGGITLRFDSTTRVNVELLPQSINATGTGTMGAAAPAKVPYYFDREITAGDLEPLTLRELDLVRNTIFALKGHTFRKQWLRDYFKAQPWYRPAEAKNEVKPSARDQKNAEFVAKYAAGIPGEVIAKKVQALLKKASRTAEEEVELTLAARAIGITAFPTEALSPLDDPSQLDKGVIDPGALSDLSRRDLRILRNLIYARRGRPFKSPILREYFERMEWYHADPKYTDARLTKNDKRNIKIVQDLESQVGGPLTDAEMSGDDAGAFMGAA